MAAGAAAAAGASHFDDESEIGGRATGSVLSEQQDSTWYDEDDYEGAEEDEEDEEDEEYDDDDVDGAYYAAESTFRGKLWVFLDDPAGWQDNWGGANRWCHVLSAQWGPAALGVALLTLCVILASCVTLVVQSYPEHHGSRQQSPWFPMETAFVVYFTIEYGMRLWASPDRRTFISQPLNVVDLASILPYYVDVISGGAFPVDLRTLRLIRVVRVFRVLRISPGMEENTDTVIKTFNKSKEVLLLYLCVLAITVIVWSSALYYFERLEVSSWNTVLELWTRRRRDYGDCGGYCFVTEVSPFQSILHSLWWCIATVTTVGFGDDVPESLGGRLIASCAMISGIFVLALPTSILGSNFLRVYNEKARRASSRSGQSEALKSVHDGSWRMDEYIGYLDFIVEERRMLSVQEAEYLKRACWCPDYLRRIAWSFEATRTFHEGLRLQLERSVRYVGRVKRSDPAEVNRQQPLPIRGVVECEEAWLRYACEVKFMEHRGRRIPDNTVVDFCINRACLSCGSIERWSPDNFHQCSAAKSDKVCRLLPVAVDLHVVEVDYHQLKERWLKARGVEGPGCSLWTLAHTPCPSPAHELTPATTAVPKDLRRARGRAVSSDAAQASSMPGSPVSASPPLRPAAPAMAAADNGSFLRSSPSPSSPRAAVTPRARRPPNGPSTGFTARRASSPTPTGSTDLRLGSPLLRGSGRSFASMMSPSRSTMPFSATIPTGTVPFQVREPSVPTSDPGDSLNTTRKTLRATLRSPSAPSRPQSPARSVDGSRVTGATEPAPGGSPLSRRGAPAPLLDLCGSGLPSSEAEELFPRYVGQPGKLPEWASSRCARDRMRRCQHAKLVQLRHLDVARDSRFATLSRVLLEHVRDTERELRDALRSEREAAAAAASRRSPCASMSESLGTPPRSGSVRSPNPIHTAIPDSTGD
eukprot:TRINITY_DN28708_c0_g1_i1.p1 TRINITY_DN28708_c0_g1~~TRINITY_DN28708_c0_g1_i1.p1  ORF type:complete len:928 (+),score=196.45 TRINITY_DN28708_c0_g1_i1:223-3006(+)